MQQYASSFKFKENVAIPSSVSFLFGLAALVIAVAAALKAGDGLVWLVLSLAALGLAGMLFYFVYISLRYRQIITVTPQEISSQSRAYGLKKIQWREITDIREVQTRIEKVRSAAPLVEVMLSLYLNLPFQSGGERRGLLQFEAGPERNIAIRQHLIYPHRLDELRQAIFRFAPTPARNRESDGGEFLKINSNN